MNLVKTLFVSLLFLFACSGSNQVDDVGTVKLSLTNIPTSVACLKIIATNSVRSVERDVALVNAAGSPGYVVDTSYLVGLPTGDVTLEAAAYDVACEQVTLTTVPTWKSFPLIETVEITEGIPYDWNLTMRPNGYVSPDVDWEGDNVSTVCSFSIPKWSSMLQDPQFVYTVNNCTTSVTGTSFWIEGTPTYINNGIPGIGTLEYTKLCESDNCTYYFEFICSGTTLTINHTGTASNIISCNCSTNC